MNKFLRERMLRAVIELHRQGFSQRKIAQKIGVSQSSVSRMLCNFAPEIEYEVEDMEEKDRSDKGKSREQQLREENARLKAELKKARQEADFQGLRADVFDEMINIAERKFGISIRKKSGVKR